MTTIRRAAPPAALSTKPVSSKGITPADAAAAKKLKPAINELMMRVRMSPTPTASQPKWDAKSNVYRAPNGHALFPVPLTTPPKGSADMFSTSALVDPVSNTFFVHTTGGFAGVSTYTGPLGVPAGAQFKGAQYSLAQLKLLEAAAVKKSAPPAFHATPTVQSASYSPGMGARPPPGVYGGPRVDLTVTFPNITYQATTTVKLDEKHKTLTVVVDASSGNPDSRSMTRPEDLSVHVPRPGKAGATYTLLIEDHAGKVLKRSTFKNVLPM